MTITNSSIANSKIEKNSDLFDRKQAKVAIEAGTKDAAAMRANGKNVISNTRNSQAQLSGQRGSRYSTSGKQTTS